MFPFNLSSQKKISLGVNAPLDERGRSALHLAVENNDEVAVQRLLRIGANINAADKQGQTPIFGAVAQKHIHMIELLTSRGAKVSHRDQQGRSLSEWAIETKADSIFLDVLAGYGAPFEPAQKTKRTPLHLAASEGRADLVAGLLLQGIDINARDAEGKTPLHLATAAGHIDTMRALVEAGANAALRDSDIVTPLYIAAEKGNVAAVDYLLTLPEVRIGINQHAAYQNGYTPVMAAASKNHVAVIEKLAAVGADLNKTDNQNRHSLFIAVESGQTDAVRKLIALGADVGKDVLSNSNKSSMMHWIDEKHYTEILTLLVEAGANINAVDSNGQTPLHRACDYTRQDKILPLLQMGAEVNGINKSGQRPIDELVDNYSYRNGDMPEAIHALLRAGADPGLSPSPLVQRAPLHVAAEAGHIQSTKLLLQKGAPADVTERSGMQHTPLHLAAESGHTSVGELLMAHGANPRKVDTDGRNALHLAARGGYEGFINLMIDKAGVDINARDKNGWTALHHACATEKPLAIALLIAKGADVNATDNDGMTPLHRAMTEGSDDAIDAYVKTLGAKADYDVLSEQGDTPLQHAVRRGLERSINKLLAAGADITAQGSDGQSALHTAMIENKQSIAMILAQALQTRGINPDVLRDNDGNNPLHIAARTDSRAVADKLIDCGADIHQPNENGDTPLHIAARAESLSMLSMLVDKGAKVLVHNKEGDTPIDIVIAADQGYLFDIMTPAAISEEKAAAEKNQPPKPAPPQGPRPPAP